VLLSQPKQFYHEEMTGDVPLMWFCSVIPKLEPDAIVTDSISYYSVKVKCSFMSLSDLLLQRAVSNTMREKQEKKKKNMNMEEKWENY